jgi:hypothetical protein
MRFHRNGVAVAVALAVVGGSGAAVAHASSAAVSVLYVNVQSTSCNDAGTGTQAAPFCNLQAAFDVVSAGQTVQVAPGNYPRPATLSRSGTASAPITLQFGQAGQPYTTGSSPILTQLQSSTTSPLTLSGASYVDVNTVGVNTNQDTAPAIAVQNSSHVSITGAVVNTAATGDGIAVSGSGSDVALTRDTLTTAGAAVRVTGAGVTGTVITNDKIKGVSDADTSGGVVVDGATGTDVVSNSVADTCTSGIGISGGASGTVVENNIVSVDQFLASPGGAGDQCPTTSADAVGLSVAADSTAGTTEKYDTISYYFGTPVEWAGTPYMTAGDYQAASGQGAADLVLTGTAAPYTMPAADFADSADALAPNEPATDFSGNPRADDPQVANTGTGDGYVDRGTQELQDGFQAELESVQSTGPLGANASFFVTICGGSWGGDSYTGTLSWGDGTTTPEASSDCLFSHGFAGHEYAKPGVYTVTFTATNGYTTRTTSQVLQTEGSDYTPYGPTRILDTRTGLGAAKAPIVVGGHVRLKIAGNGSIPADVTAVTLNLTVTDATGTGSVGTSEDYAPYTSPTALEIYYSKGQTIADSAVVQVVDGYIDIYTEGASGSADVIADVSGYFSQSAASGYQPAPRARILDTRKGIGAPLKPVGGASGIPVAVSGVDSIPSGISAVAVHITVADPAGYGWVAAEPDGAGVPSTSIINYVQGQIVSNTVFVPVGADGKIELYNGGGNSVDLLADVSGYFSASAPDVFMPISPYVGPNTGITGPLAAYSTSHFPFTREPLGTVALIGTAEVSQPATGGYITAYPDDVTRPVVSDINFQPNQTVANLDILDTATDENPATYVYNGSPGTTQFNITVSGYFTGS